jgi:hypothetical protein
MNEERGWFRGEWSKRTKFSAPGQCTAHAQLVDTVPTRMTDGGIRRGTAGGGKRVVQEVCRKFGRTELRPDKRQGRQTCVTLTTGFCVRRVKRSFSATTSDIQPTHACASISVYRKIYSHHILRKTAIKLPLHASGGVHKKHGECLTLGWLKNSRRKLESIHRIYYPLFFPTIFHRSVVNGASHAEIVKKVPV